MSVPQKNWKVPERLQKLTKPVQRLLSLCRALPGRAQRDEQSTAYNTEIHLNNVLVLDNNEIKVPVCWIFDSRSHVKKEGHAKTAAS